MVLTLVTLATNLKMKVIFCTGKKLLALKNPTFLGNTLDMKLKVFPITTRGSMHSMPELCQALTKSQESSLAIGIECLYYGLNYR